MATQAEVQTLFKDLLGREAGEEGLAHWTKDNQGSLADIASNIKAGSEYRTGKVKDIYSDFGLTADDAGVKHFVDSGDDFQKIQDDIGTHFQKGGSLHDDAVTKLQGIYDTHYGTAQDGTSNKIVGDDGIKHWLGEGGLTEDATGHGGGMGSWDSVAANIALHNNPYASLDGDDDGVNDPLNNAGVNDLNKNGIIDDDEVGAITTKTGEDIDKTITNAVNNNGGFDIDTIVNSVLDKLDTDTGDEGLDDDNLLDDSLNNAAGTLAQTNNEAIQALTNTLAGASDKIKSLDLTGVQDDISGVEGDLTKLQGKFSGLQTQLDNTGAQNLAQIKQVLADEGYAAQLTNLDSTFSSNISSLTNKLNTLTTDITGTQLDVTNLSGDFQAKLDSLQTDLTADTTKQFSAIQTDYNEATQQLSQLQGQLNTANQTAATNLANQKKAFDAKMAANMATQQNNFANLSTDVNSKLTNYSEEQKAKFADVYKTREQAIGELQTDWGNRLQKQEAGLQNKIQATSENLNERLTNISKNMNYRMLGDSAAGIKMRRSKAFTSGRTSKGTGQMNRAMRIQSLNL